MYFILKSKNEYKYWNPIRQVLLYSSCTKRITKGPSEWGCPAARSPAKNIFADLSNTAAWGLCAFCAESLRIFFQKNFGPPLEAQRCKRHFSHIPMIASMPKPAVFQTSRFLRWRSTLAQIDLQRKQKTCPTYQTAGSGAR